MPFNPNAFHRLPEFLLDVAIKFPQKIAIQEISETGIKTKVSFSELVIRIKNSAEDLKKQGIAPGDRVAIIEENSIDWVVAFFAILEIGATLVIIDPRLETSDFEKLITVSDPQMIMTTDRFLLKIPANQRQSICCWNLETQKSIGVQKNKAHNRDGDPEAALILFTSGTGGAFKAVVLEHEALLHSIEKTLNGHDIQPKDRYLTILPLTHIYGLTILLTALARGATTTFLKKIQSDLILRAMQEDKTTIFPAVPRILELFHSKIAEKLDKKPYLKKLMAISGKIRSSTGWNIGKYLFMPVHKVFGGCLNLFSGGASLNREVHEQLHALGFTVIQGYGLTETAAMVIGTTPKNPALGISGRALPGVELRIDAVQGHTAGEICIQSPTLMRGYFRDFEATNQVLKDGWFHTGDLGFLDAKGNLFITGRLKEVIVTSSGQKAMPLDIEERYRGLPGIKEMAIVGIPSLKGTGEEIHAAIVVADDLQLSLNSLSERFKKSISERSEKVPPHLRIQHFHILTALPKTLTLKVKRDELKEMVQKKWEAREDEEEEDGQYDETTKQLFEIISCVCKQNGKPLKKLHSKLSFELDLNFDSLTSLELAYAIEKHFNVQLSETMPIRTIDDADNQIRRLMGKRET